MPTRACLKIPSGAVFAGKAGWRGATKENTPCGSSTEEQRSQTAFPTKTLRAAALLDWGFVVANVTARSGDVPSAPPRPNPKSPAAALLAIFRQALRSKHTTFRPVIVGNSHPHDQPAVSVTPDARCSGVIVVNETAAGKAVARGRVFT